MIQIDIIRRFDSMEIVKDLCVDYAGIVKDDTILLPDLRTFNKIIHLLVPAFLPQHKYKIRKYLDFKEIKEQHNDFTD